MLILTLQIHDKEGKEAIRQFMEKEGYFVKALVTHPNWWANDFIFVKNSFAPSSGSYQIETNDLV